MNKGSSSRKSPKNTNPTNINGNTIQPATNPINWAIIVSLLVLILAVATWSILFNYEFVQFDERPDGEVNSNLQDITHWEFGKQIGKGGYSRVFLGRRKTSPGSHLLLPPPDPAIGNQKYDHAIKIIPKARYFRQSMDPNSKKINTPSHEHLYNAVWSERNAWVAFSLPKPIPYVIPLSHIFQDRHALYYIVPLINGGDLDRSLNMFGPMNEYTVRYYTASIITALEGMHARGYVYKDIKLKNLLLDEDGKLQITDFGLTRLAIKNHYDESIPTNCVTNGVPGRAGTKSYKSPEILSGQGHSYPSDFYALGVVLYKMMTGHKLYHSDNDIPLIKHYLRIPKYHHYILKSSKWRAYGVYDMYSKVQNDLQLMQNGAYKFGDTYNVLDYELQGSYLTYHINEWLSDTFSNEMGKAGKENLEKVKKIKIQEEIEKNNNNFNDNNNDDSSTGGIDQYDSNDDNNDHIGDGSGDGSGDAEHSDGDSNNNDLLRRINLQNSKNFKKKQQHNHHHHLHHGQQQDHEQDHQSLKLNFTPDELFVDGVGPIFGPDEAIKYLKEKEQGKVSNSKGKINGKLAWLSLTDDVIDFLTQLTDLNPFYRLGTANRRLRDYDPSHYNIKNAPDTIEIDPKSIDTTSSTSNKHHLHPEHPQTGHIVDINSNVQHKIEPIIQNFKHTETALISFQKFNYQEDVISIAEDMMSSPSSSSSPSTHCFEQFIDVEKELPSFKGRDSNGKWRGLHSGFVEIKNHPWFKNFDWDQMAEINTKNQNIKDEKNKKNQKQDEKNNNKIEGHKLIQFASVDVKNYKANNFPYMIDAKDDHFDERYQSMFKGLEFGTKL